jgi:hypothetical protein
MDILCLCNVWIPPDVLKDPDGHLFRVMYHERDDVKQSGVN